MYIEDGGLNSPLSFGSLQELPKKKEKQMRTEIGSIAIHTPPPALPPEDAGRDHLLRRISDIFGDKREELYDKYMRLDCPKTFGEAREWIKKGLFRLEVDKHYKDDADFTWHGHDLTWGKKERDDVGFGKAIDKLSEARTAAKDIVMVKTDEDARLKALHTFANWKE